MKRQKLVLVFVFAVLLFALLHFLVAPKSAPNAPRYISLTNPPAITSTNQLYSWGDPVPFQDGRFWVYVLTRTGPTNWQRNYYLYDLQQRQPVAEMQNGTAIFFNADHTRLLCSGYGPTTLADHARSILSRITRGKINLATNLYRESFWILDLRSNSAVHVGGFSQASGSGSRWIPAPGFRFAYNRPSTSAWGREFYLCDLDQQLLKKVDFTGDLLGWWNDHQIFARDASANFVAYDVQTGQTSNVFTAQTIAQFLAKSDLANGPATYAATFDWNGRDYNWYLSGDRKNGLDTNSTWLLKADRTGPSLKLLLRDFHFHWLGHFDDSGKHYIYQGEPGAPGSGGNGSVLLLDLANNVTRTIVPPWTSNQYSLVRQSGDTIIYSSNRILWRVDLNTTNAELLFPPPPQK